MTAHPTRVQQPADVDGSGGEEEEQHDDEPQQQVEEGEEGYWDEEDEIENYLKDRFEGGEESSDEEAGSDAGGSRADTAAAPRPDLGANPDMDALNAETQRILRGEIL